MKISKLVLGMVVLSVFIVSFIIGYVVSMQFLKVNVVPEEVAQIEYPELDEVKEVEEVVVEEKPDLAQGSLFVDELGLFLAYPPDLKVRKVDGNRDDLLGFRLEGDEKAKDELIIDIDIATMESVKRAADNYGESSEFCIDHDLCDENFDTQDFVNGFENLKSVTVGNGEQVKLSSKLFGDVNNGYYDQADDELLTINGRKFVVNNMSSVPGGMVWRSYITFVNDARITIAVSWGFDRKVDDILHKYDKEADAIAQGILVGS